jgi:hypothetical protein
MKRITLSSLVPLLLASGAALAVACESSDPGAEPAPQAPDAGADAAPVIECPAPTSGPTVHEGDVDEDEVWAADASPHIVAQDVRVRSGAKLTIEPCAEVQVAAGKFIHVAFPGTPNTGSLVAEGTATQPIRIHGQDGARWASLHVHAPGTARLAHVTLEDGGDNRFGRNATLEIRGDSEDGADALLFVDHVTVAKSLGTGAYMRGGSAFMEGSQELTIRESGDDETPFPMVIEEPAIGSLPSGTYTGNRKDEILLDPVGGKVAGTGLLADATMKNRGVPYHVGDSSVDSFRIGGRVDKQLVTLTIEAGVVLKFEPQTSLRIQHFTDNQPSTAAIRALGTADAPVVFTSAAETPSAGDWRGLWFGGVPSATNQLDHVRIEHAGYDCSCGLNTCSINLPTHDGAVIFTEQPPSAFITNSVFSNIAGNGITQGFDGDLVNFRPTNTFEAVSGCVQTHPRNPDTSCPDPRPVCDGLE